MNQYIMLLGVSKVHLILSDCLNWVLCPSQEHISFIFGCHQLWVKFQKVIHYSMLRTMCRKVYGAFNTYHDMWVQFLSSLLKDLWLWFLNSECLHGERIVTTYFQILVRPSLYHVYVQYWNVLNYSNISVLVGPKLLCYIMTEPF